jgi:hypothetical protein
MVKLQEAENQIVIDYEVYDRATAERHGCATTDSLSVISL